jgi:hypothetical protein
MVEITFAQQAALTNTKFRSLGKALTRQQYDVAVAERNEFGSWVREVLLPQPSDGTAFDKILLMPSGDTEPFYRHEYHA